MSVIRSPYKMVTLTPENVFAFDCESPFAQLSRLCYHMRNCATHHRRCEMMDKWWIYLRFRDSTMPRSCHWGDADAGRGDISCSGVSIEAQAGPGRLAENGGTRRGSTRGAKDPEAGGPAASRTSNINKTMSTHAPPATRSGRLRRTKPKGI